LVLSPDQRSFHMSAARSESDFKRDRRMNRKARDEASKRKRREWWAEQPDPYLGIKLDVSPSLRTLHVVCPRFTR
jgi:hypothetical protein